MLVKIYTDGAARGNPDGPGGYGCVLHYTDRNGNLQIGRASCREIFTRKSFPQDTKRQRITGWN